MMSLNTTAATGVAALTLLGCSLTLAQESPSPPPKNVPAEATDAAPPSTIAPLTNNEADAKKIVAGAVKAYASCRSYADEGHVTLTLYRGEAARSRLLPFSTKFVRSENRFRFEFKEQNTEDGEWGTYIIWGVGGKVRTWWHRRRQVQEKDTLKQALEDASGVSVGCTIKVPPLLLTEQSMSSMFNTLENLEFVRQERVDEVVCDQIQGTHPRGATFTIWIDNSQKLVRKVVQRKHYENEGFGQ